MSKHFLIAILIFLVGYSCNSKEDNEQHHYHSKIPPLPSIFGLVITFDSIAIAEHGVVRDSEVYHLLNDAFVPQGKLTSVEKLKLLNITTKDITSELSSGLIEEILLEDHFNFQLIDSGIYAFDCGQLKNTICIPVSEYLDIFSSRDYSKNWEDFINKHGNYGLHYFSIPIFNLNRNKAIIIAGGNGSPSHGSKELYFLIKKNGKWTVYKELQLEVT